MDQIGLSLFFNIIMCWYRVWGRGCDTTDSQMSPQPRRNLPIKWDFMVLCASMWLPNKLSRLNYNDLIMRAMASQITGVSVVCSTVCLGADQRKHQSSASLGFVRRIHWWLMDSPHKGPVTRKMFPFHVIMSYDSIWFGYARKSYSSSYQRHFHG